MSDRELLEKAAKAAELIPIEFSESAGYMEGLLYVWNPLNDDGDALRLAVTLDLDVFQSVCYSEARVGGALQSMIFQPWGEDKAAATRRAIVRAAASIAESKGE